MVLICDFTPSRPSASIFSGVSAALNSPFVARFTPSSVAWADSTTATRSVNGLLHSRSLVGSGSRARKRLKNSWISAFFIVLEEHIDRARDKVKLASITKNGLALVGEGA